MFELKNDNIIVRELFDDIVVNGVSTPTDQDSPYMFCEVVESSVEDIKKEDILVIRRYAKEEFITGLFFISPKDIRCRVSKEYYNMLINEGVEI